MPPNPYYILFPKNIVSSQTINISHPIPKEVREFGYLPDKTQLLPGDLLLFHHTRPPFVSRSIIKAQLNGGHHADDAKWHHAAVYIGNLMICEAQISGGVQLAFLYEKYIGKHEIRIRRDQNLNSAQRYDIVINALFRLRTRYSFRSIARLLIGSQRGFWRHPFQSFGDAQSTICSQLYADAYALTTNHLIVQKGIGLSTPADLSLTPQLSDIQVNWLKLK